MSKDYRKPKYYEIRPLESPEIEERSPELYNLFSPRRRRRTIIIKETKRSSGRPGRLRIERSPSPRSPSPPLERRRYRSPGAAPRIITRSPSLSPVRRRPRVQTPSPPPSRRQRSSPTIIHQAPMSPPPLSGGNNVPLPPKLPPRTTKPSRPKRSSGRYEWISDNEESDYNKPRRENPPRPGQGYEVVGHGQNPLRNDFDRDVIPRSMMKANPQHLLDLQRQRQQNDLARQDQMTDAMFQLAESIRRLQLQEQEYFKKNDKRAADLTHEIEDLKRKLHRRQQQQEQQDRGPPAAPPVIYRAPANDPYEIILDAQNDLNQEREDRRSQERRQRRGRGGQ